MDNWTRAHTGDDSVEDSACKQDRRTLRPTPVRRVVTSVPARVVFLAVLRRRSFANVRRCAVQRRPAGVRAKSRRGRGDNLEGAAELVGSQAVRQLDRLELLMLRLSLPLRRLRS